MMGWIFTGLIVISVLFGCLNGRMPEVSSAAIGGCAGAVELFLTLLGSICLWTGLLKVADKAGLTAVLSKLISPVTKRLFRGMDPASPAAKAICMNITANFLGLGNAATPLGIAAMKEMQKASPEKHTASRHMITFVVLNTASIQLIPTNTAMLRLQNGSTAPMDIMPSVWLTSVVTVAVGLMAVKVCSMLCRDSAPGAAKPPGRISRLLPRPSPAPDASAPKKSRP